MAGGSMPHANFKIEAQTANQKKAVLQAVDEAAVALGFTLEENDWKKWQGIVEPARLEEKKQERRYTKQNFEIYYRPLYRPEPTGYIRLSFYEGGERQFSDSGIDLYYQLKSELSKRDLVHLPETPEDVAAARSVVTPEEFNEKNPPRSLMEKAKHTGLLVFSFLVYALIVFVPGWRFAAKLITKLSIAINARRAVFAVLCALCLFPVPFPMSMFGPVILVPACLGLPFVIGGPEQLLVFSGLSFAFSLVLSLGVAMRLIRQPSSVSSPDTCG